MICTVRHLSDSFHKKTKFGKETVTNKKDHLILGNNDFFSPFQAI